MKLLLVVVTTLSFLAIPWIASAAPDESQRAMIQEVQEAKQNLAQAEAAKGAERQKMMQDHMAMMQGVMAQMQKAKPGGSMTAEQMREWIDEHMKLMNDLLGQMMSEHHLMMQSSGIPYPIR